MGAGDCAEWVGGGEYFCRKGLEHDVVQFAMPAHIIQA